MIAAVGTRNREPTLITRTGDSPRLTPSELNSLHRMRPGPSVQVRARHLSLTRAVVHLSTRIL